MKRTLALIFVLLFAVSLFAGCNKKDNASGSDLNKDGTYELALVTDVGNIDDQSFNQSCYEAVVQFGTTYGIDYAYYRPSEDSTEARVETMKTAIDKGAKTIVCPGYMFEDAVYEMQTAYPNVNFILIDGEPHTPDYATYHTEKNVYCILYKEEQAGYLAGYAAVKDGYTELGFCGGMDVPAVIRYGYGFVQGADAAAAEMGVDVNIKYYYCGSFGPSDDLQTKMSSWYTEGTQVVFACGGSLYLSVVAAADAANAKVIGVDVDQSYVSDKIITSAMKQLKTSTMLALKALNDNGGTWPAEYAGVTAVLGAAEDCVGLPTDADSWRFTKFTVDEYTALFNKLVSGEIVVSNDTSKAPATTRAVVDYQS
ncbi:MAG: BMP family ABC transporter substrate-binding protein [Papillibacter sp.]|nr:BMP family ABC transporter substrate-binding protein [Papillibacter sp.]